MEDLHPFSLIVAMFIIPVVLVVLRPTIAVSSPPVSSVVSAGARPPLMMVPLPSLSRFRSCLLSSRRKKSNTTVRCQQQQHNTQTYLESLSPELERMFTKPSPPSPSSFRDYFERAVKRGDGGRPEVVDPPGPFPPGSLPPPMSSYSLHLPLVDILISFPSPSTVTLDLGRGASTLPFAWVGAGVGELLFLDPYAPPGASYEGGALRHWGVLLDRVAWDPCNNMLSLVDHKGGMVLHRLDFTADLSLVLPAPDPPRPITLDYHAGPAPHSPFSKHEYRGTAPGGCVITLRGTRLMLQCPEGGGGEGYDCSLTTEGAMLVCEAAALLEGLRAQGLGRGMVKLVEVRGRVLMFTGHNILELC